VTGGTVEWHGLKPPYATILADPPWPYPEGFAGGHSRTRGKWEGPVKAATAWQCPFCGGEPGVLDNESAILVPHRPRDASDALL